MGGPQICLTWCSSFSFHLSSQLQHNVLYVSHSCLSQVFSLLYPKPLPNSKLLLITCIKNEALLLCYISHNNAPLIVTKIKLKYQGYFYLFGQSNNNYNSAMKEKLVESVGSVKIFSKSCDNHIGLREEFKFQDSLLMLKLDLSSHLNYDKTQRSQDLLLIKTL